MERSPLIRGRRALWIERLAWNAAAAAALAFMVWILLCSLQWLDRIAPRADRPGPIGPTARLETEPDAGSRRLAEGRGPSG